MVGAVASLVISAVWCFALPAIGPRLGYVDHPDDEVLKVHSTPAVPLAGPGLLVALIVGLALNDAAVPVAEVAGLALLTLLGMVDDRIQLSPFSRIVVEVIAAALVASRWWGLGPGYAIVGALVVLVAVNAVNLYDGLDGLAGATGGVGLGVIAVVAWVSDAPFLLPAMLAAALVGFLPFNLHPARVFLGDGGAYLVGAVTAVALWDVGVRDGWWGAAASIGFLGMFAVDLAVTILRRIRSGDPLFQGDRRHLYDLIVASGVAVPKVSLRLAGSHLVLVSLVGTAVVTMPPAWSAAAAAGLGLVAVIVGVTTVSPAR